MNSAQHEYCEISIVPGEDLLFSVKVMHRGKAYVRGGFQNPDAAQKRGVEMMLAMDHWYAHEQGAAAIPAN